MKKEIAITIVLLTVLFGIMTYLILKEQITLTGNVISETPINKYSYTKAICNESNFCQDYEVECENGQIRTLTPLSGAVVQNPSDWKDPRENKSEIECE